MSLTRARFFTMMAVTAVLTAVAVKAGKGGVPPAKIHGWDVVDVGWAAECRYAIYRRHGGAETLAEAAREICLASELKKYGKPFVDESGYFDLLQDLWHQCGGMSSMAPQMSLYRDKRSRSCRLLIVEQPSLWVALCREVQARITPCKPIKTP
jgi:hypothetical protein